MKDNKFYVIWRGKKTGVFNSWDECKANVSGFRNAKFKAFPSKTAAEQAFLFPYKDFISDLIKMPDTDLKNKAGLIIPSYCVDASCIYNPGPVEFRCVDTSSQRIMFSEGPYVGGTNNIGEFLAIVHALSYLMQSGVSSPIYTDSQTAIQWVRTKKCKTKQIRNKQNAQLFDLINEAERWLSKNTYWNKVLKWNTKQWNENPADYKRK